MKALFSFLIISLFLASCGTSTSFSKRKHLSGHFWKKSGGHGNPETRTFEEESRTFSEQDNPELSVVLESESLTIEEVKDYSNNEESAAGLDEWTEYTIDSEEVLVEKNSPNPPETDIDSESESFSTKKSNDSDWLNKVNFYYAFLYIGAVGLVLIILWFILNALEAVGIWMLILGLSVLGAAIIGLIILFLSLTLLF